MSVKELEGILSPDDERLSGAKLALARQTNPACVRGELADALDGADVFIGVSAGNVLPVEALAGMNERAVVFPMANPTPEVDPVRARQYAAADSANISAPIPSVPMATLAPNASTGARPTPLFMFERAL